MKRTREICLYIFFLICLISCQKEDSFLVLNDHVSSNADLDEYKWRQEQNAWIFSKMRDSYFWNDQLRDSLAYDYSLHPKEFFKSLLVKEDRFSYCIDNEAYIRIGYSGTRRPFKRSSLLELQDAHPLHYFIFVPQEGFEPSSHDP